MGDSPLTDKRPWYWPSMADVLFALFLVVCLVGADQGMMDDPGLGWHLGIAELIWETGCFPDSEVFCYPTEGRPWVPRAWLGDAIFWLAHAWGGLNGIAVVTALVIAATVRLLYTRMVADGIPFPAAAFWAFVAGLGIRLSQVARPNIYTLFALALVAGICERFHSGAISKRATLWLIPVFLLWPNMHGGYLAGVIVLVVTYFVECAIAVAGTGLKQRQAATQRLRWLTGLGAVLFVATLANPYGFRLHVSTYEILTNSYLQENSTREWLAPDFSDKGWFPVEAMVLAFPVLAALSSRRIALLSLTLSAVWLHFALTGQRYVPLWAIIVAPTLAQLSCHLPIVKRMAASLRAIAPAETRSMRPQTPRALPVRLSLVIAVVAIVAAPWMGPVAGHCSHHMPAAELDQLLEISSTARVFHSVNWGGYLTWHGKDRKPRFQTWIDDRTDVHGQDHLAAYYAIMRAESGWQAKLDEFQVDWLCIPAEATLADRAVESPNWVEKSRSNGVVTFRRISPRIGDVVDTDSLHPDAD